MSNRRLPRERSASLALPTVRTTDGLRDVLFEELDALRAGRSNPQRASAVAKLACQIINSVRMEVAFASHVRSTAGSGDGPVPMTPLRLGGDR